MVKKFTWVVMRHSDRWDKTYKDSKLGKRLKDLAKVLVSEAQSSEKEDMRNIVTDWVDDPSATEVGRAIAYKTGTQIRRAIRSFAPKYVLTSPALRCVQTSTEVIRPFQEATSSYETPVVSVIPFLAEYYGGTNGARDTTLYGDKGIPNEFKGREITPNPNDDDEVDRERFQTLLPYLLSEYPTDSFIVTHQNYVGYLHELLRGSKDKTIDPSKVGYCGYFIAQITVDGGNFSTKILSVDLNGAR